MARRKLTISEKVRETRVILGSRRAMVDVMDAASVTSLKRWEGRECVPLRAHALLVNEAHNMARRMGKVLKRRMKRLNRTGA